MDWGKITLFLACIIFLMSKPCFSMEKEEISHVTETLQKDSNIDTEGLSDLTDTFFEDFPGNNQTLNMISRQMVFNYQVYNKILTSFLSWFLDEYAYRPRNC